MLELGEDIIAHHLLPQLHLKDLLSLRQTCKSVQANIDANEWDRRYFQEFHFDAVRLAGRGMDRYIKRYFATPKHMGYVDWQGKPIAHSTHDKSLKYFEKSPIVDFDIFEMEMGCEDSDFGVVMRGPDGDIKIHTEYGINACLDTSNLSELYLFEDELVARRDGVPMKCNLTSAFWEDECEDAAPRNDPEILHVQEDSRSTENMSDYSFRQLVGPVDAPNSRPAAALNVASPPLKYLLYKRFYNENYVKLQPIVEALVECLPGAAETFWFRVVDRPSYIVTGSYGKTLYVISGGEDYKWPRSYDFPNEIVKVEGFIYYYNETHLCDINVLDTKGTLYCLRFTGNQVSEAEWQYPLDSVEPHMEMENVADITETCALLKDGTIRCFAGMLQRWCDMGIQGAVLITEYAYLTTK